MKRLRLIVRPDEEGLAVEALALGRGGLKPEQFQAVLTAGGVTLDRRRATRADQPVKSGQELFVHLEARGRAAEGPRALPASCLLHLDDDLVIIDKPAFLAAQATQVDVAAGLDAAVRALLEGTGVRKPFVGLVHRLDFETTGATAFARTPEALSVLTAQFREGGVRKRYDLLVQGAPDWEEREVDQPIAADPDRTGRFQVSPRGKASRTVFRVVERFVGAGLAAARLEARPATGRTHQIRVHAAFLGHPLLGDRRYGGPEALTSGRGERVELGRVCLHAGSLSFKHPRGQAFSCEAAWPEDLSEAVAALRRATRSPDLAGRRPDPPLARGT